MSNSQKIQVVNIKCGGCKNTVTKALEALGAQDISIDIPTGTIEYSFDGDRNTVIDKLCALGYPEVGSDKATSFLKKAVSYTSCAIGKM